MKQATQVWDPPCACGGSCACCVQLVSTHLSEQCAVLKQTREKCAVLLNVTALCLSHIELLRRNCSATELELKRRVDALEAEVSSLRREQAKCPQHVQNREGDLEHESQTAVNQMAAVEKQHVEHLQLLRGLKPKMEEEISNQKVELRAFFEDYKHEARRRLELELQLLRDQHQQTRREGTRQEREKNPVNTFSESRNDSNRDQEIVEMTRAEVRYVTNERPDVSSLSHLDPFQEQDGENDGQVEIVDEDITISNAEEVEENDYTCYEPQVEEWRVFEDSSTPELSDEARRDGMAWWSDSRTDSSLETQSSEDSFPPVLSPASLSANQEEVSLDENKWEITLPDLILDGVLSSHEEVDSEIILDAFEDSKDSDVFNSTVSTSASKLASLTINLVNGRFGSTQDTPKITTSSNYDRVPRGTKRRQSSPSKGKESPTGRTSSMPRMTKRPRSEKAHGLSGRNKTSVSPSKPKMATALKKDDSELCHTQTVLAEPWGLSSPTTQRSSWTDRSTPGHLCKRFARRQLLFGHEVSAVGDDEERSLECAHCGRSLVGEGGLQSHLLLVHPDKDPTECGMCERKFKTTSSLREHQNTNVHSRNKIMFRSPHRQWLAKCAKERDARVDVDTLKEHSDVTYFHEFTFQHLF